MASLTLLRYLLLHSSSWRFSQKTAALSALQCLKLFSQSPSMTRANSLKCLFDIVLCGYEGAGGRVGGS